MPQIGSIGKAEISIELLIFKARCFKQKSYIKILKLKAYKLSLYPEK